MSDEKRTWYQRTHQFTPYTKADGTAVSDEFDAIQASFERIPAMRDDGKGFTTSPLIPEPSNPYHPVPLKMLTETEASVNNARDEVLEKAQQVAQNTQSVEANTLIATQKANTATQAAASAQSSQQAASNSENMAHKWAANPVNEVVQGDKYSSYHYATKAEQSAENLASAESSAIQSATIATQKAEEATRAAQKAESLAAGEIDYTKVLNVPRSNINTEGVVRLTNDTGLESESLALTAKAGKKLAQQTAQLQLNVSQNYIPNSKKSSAVNSGSEDNVATSKAVKTAYDKGVEAKTAADNAQSSANTANNNANGRVSKSGDTMTGILNLNREDALLRWQRNGVNKFAVGFRNTTSEDLLLYNYAFNTEFALREHDLYCNKPLNLPGALFENGDYAGFSIKNSSGRYVRVECNPHSSNNMLSFVYRESNGSNINVVFIPKKNGNILLDADFTYQKIGNFEVRKYPDGKMIQTYFVQETLREYQDLQPKANKSFTWAQAFVESPLISETVMSSNETLSCCANIFVTSNNRVCYYNRAITTHGVVSFPVHIKFQFFAIGRWK